MRLKVSKIDSLKIDPLKTAGIVFLGLVIFLIIGFTFLPKYTKIKEFVAESKALSKNIEKTKEEIDRIKQDLSDLKKGPFYFEKVARKESGAVKEGEVVIHIENQTEER